MKFLIVYCSPVSFYYRPFVPKYLSKQWRTEGVWGVQTPPPEIPMALQNCAKLNPICENC